MKTMGAAQAGMRFWLAGAAVSMMITGGMAMAQETGTTAEGAGTSGMDAAASNGVGAAQTPASDAQQAAAPADALATARQVEGLLTVKSKYSATDSVKRVQDALLAKGLTVFTVIDHQKAAQQQSLDMPAASVIVFGNPSMGTPMMVQSPTLAIDLPSKVLIWDDGKGNVYASLNTAEYLARRHHLPAEAVAPLAGAEKLVPAVLTK